MKTFILSLTLALAACGPQHGAQQAATEQLALRNWNETLIVEGEIKAAANTSLNVPGSGWENRVLTEMVAEGSMVKKGQVLARFDAPRARMELSQAETELLRKALGEDGISANAAVNLSELAADSAKVGSELALSQQYAHVDLAIFSRNKILDTLQDVGFLASKQHYLNWKTGQVDARSAAERGVIGSQKESVSLQAGQKRKSLAALELIAPHDGVFLLNAKWDGSKPQIGANMWSGEKFGSLPDLEKLVANFSVPEGQAFGLKTGLPLRVLLAGSGSELELIVTKVGSSASSKSRDSPVKYSEFEAGIAPAMAMQLALKPGQALRATVSLIDRKNVLTAPNIALVQDGAAYALFTSEGGKAIKHAVELGLRGPVRSEIKAGLAAGARILLLPEKMSEKIVETTVSKP